MRDRRELGAFLRARRARLTPAGAGLTTGARRRVSGLRRDELAQLAGISVEYYQRLEQGRARGPSDEVLDALAAAMGMDDVERAHLHALARPPRARPVPDRAVVRPELRGLLALMDRVPALVINDRFDVLAVNTLAELLFHGLAGVPPQRRNLARYLFADPHARRFYLDWADVAAATSAQLRRAAGLRPRDDRLAELVGDLSAGSAEFRACWATAGVGQRGSGTKNLHHPAVGVLTLTYQNFDAVDAVGNDPQRLVTFTAEPGSPTEAALALLTTWAAAGGNHVQAGVTPSP